MSSGEATLRRTTRQTPIARTVKPNVVYTSQQRFDHFVGELISRVLRIPHVVHLHYTPGPELRARTLKRLRSCDRVIAVSSFIAGRAIGIGVLPERIVVLPNTLGGPPPPVVRTGRPGRVIVGQVGRTSGRGARRRLLIVNRRSRDPRLQRAVAGCDSSLEIGRTIADRLESSLG